MTPISDIPRSVSSQTEIKNWEVIEGIGLVVKLKYTFLGIYNSAMKTDLY